MTINQPDTRQGPFSGHCVGGLHIYLLPSAKLLTKTLHPRETTRGTKRNKEEEGTGHPSKTIQPAREQGCVSKKSGRK